MDIIKLNNDFNNLVDEYYEILIYGDKSDVKKEHLELIFKILEKKFIELYNLSKSNTFFWSFCSYRTYTNTYSQRLTQFLDMNDDKGLKENDFILFEQRRLNNKNHISSAKFIPISLLEIINNETFKVIEFLEKKLGNKIGEVENPYPFVTFKAKELFDLYFCAYKNDKKRYAHISFVYWTMVKDKFIFEGCRPEAFKLILCESPYGLDLRHLKSFKKLEELKDRSRENYYYELKDSIMKSKI